MVRKTLDAQTAALLLIDHQKGTMAQVKSIPTTSEAQRAHARPRREHVRHPAVLTSSMEDHMQGPLIEELEEFLPEAFTGTREARRSRQRHGRSGLRLRGSGDRRRQFIVAGVTNDVCTVFPVLDLIDQGFDVIVAADAGGSVRSVSHWNAWFRQSPSTPLR